MNFNNKKSDDSNIDELNIRSHLNNSLDLSGIRVSEELIQKTLRAIKEQSTINYEQEEGLKKRKGRSIPWNRYARSLTGVAAAALLLLVGYQIANSALFNKTKGDMENRTFDLAQEESAQQDIYLATEDAVDNAASGIESADSVLGVTEYKMNAQGETGAEMSAPTDDDTKLENSIAPVEKEVDQGSALDDVPIKSSKDGTGREENYSITSGYASEDKQSFQEILPITVEKISKITITDEMNQKSLTLTEKPDIRAFYSLMGNYQYSSPASVPDNHLYYTIAIETTEDISYIIRVDAAFSVEMIGVEVSSMSNYSVVNQEELLRELNVFMSKY